MTKIFIKSDKKCKRFLIRTLQIFWLHLSCISIWGRVRLLADWRCRTGRWPFFLLRPEPNWKTPASQPLIHLISSLFLILELSLPLHHFGVIFLGGYVFIASCAASKWDRQRLISGWSGQIYLDGGQQLRVLLCTPCSSDARWSPGATAPSLIHGFVFEKTASIQSGIRLMRRHATLSFRRAESPNYHHLSQVSPARATASVELDMWEWPR